MAEPRIMFDAYVVEFQFGTSPAEAGWRAMATTVMSEDFRKKPAVQRLLTSKNRRFLATPYDYATVDRFEAMEMRDLLQAVTHHYPVRAARRVITDATVEVTQNG